MKYEVFSNEFTSLLKKEEESGEEEEEEKKEEGKGSPQRKFKTTTSLLETSNVKSQHSLSKE